MLFKKFDLLGTRLKNGNPDTEDIRRYLIKFRRFPNVAEMSEDFPTTSEHFQSFLRSRGNGQNIFGQQLPAFLGAAASVCMSQKVTGFKLNNNSQQHGTGCANRRNM